MVGGSGLMGMIFIDGKIVASPPAKKMQEKAAYIVLLYQGGN